MKLNSSLALSIILFLTSPLLADTEINTSRTWGVDAELLGYGGSVGAFLNFRAHDAFRYSLEADWIFVQHEDSYPYIDPYYYTPTVINQQNLSMAKWIATISYFPFLETMHPSFQVGFFASAGPILAMDTANNEGLIERWQDVKGYWSAQGRGGVQIRFMGPESNAYQLRAGYEYSNFETALDGRPDYGGLFMQVGMEFLLR